MFFNMKITAEQLLDVKCVLANVKKNQLAKELGVNSVDLSRKITNENLLVMLDDFFNSIDPEINIVCQKLQNNEILEVQETSAKYVKKNNSGLIDKLLAAQDKNIAHLEEDVWTLKLDIQKIAKVYPDILEPNFGLSPLAKTG